MANQERKKDVEERMTGTPNVEYDLISILYHSLQGAATYTEYLDDAQKLGDEELIEFIHEVIDQDRRRAEKVKRILLRHLGRTEGAEEDVGTEEVVESGEEIRDAGV